MNVPCWKVKEIREFENSGEYFYLEKLKSSETFDISFARHSWKIVVVWKNF